MTTTLYRRGRVRTSADPFATALLVDGGTVAWVGGESAADALSADVTVQLDDAWVAPAFVDAHVHATSTGLALTGLDLTSAPSLAVALDRVAVAARQARGGAVLGTGWDDTAWPEARPPTARELDAASYGGVVYLARTDVHSAVASSALLAAVPAARGAVGFVGDGLVRTDAHHLVRKAAYEAVTSSQRRAAQEAMLRRAAGLGIACVHECGGPDIGGEADFTGLLGLAGPFPAVLGYWGELGAVDRARDLGAVGAGGDLFVDGALGSHTAFLLQPYADAGAEPSAAPTVDPGYRGHGYLDVADVTRHVAACTLAGLQAGFHAIGDAALAVVLDGVARAAEQVGPAAVRGARHRVEHAEALAAGDLPRFAALGLVASVQPAFDARWGGPDGMYATRLGRERAAALNPYAAMAAAGVALAFGSDCPVTPLDPWGTLRAAVGHRSPGSALSARAAFAAHTRGGWRAARRDEPGDLVPGAPATFAVWRVDGELVVQTPDDRVAGWSTDPRAGIAGLPDLSGPDPVCLRTVLSGTVIHDAGVGSGT